MLFIVQEGDSLKDAVQDVPTAQPCIIIWGSLGKVKDAVLVVERKIVSSFPPNETPLVLVGAFYAFNMHYTERCKNLYSFLEVVFFKCKLPPKKTRLSALVAKLKC